MKSIKILIIVVLFLSTSFCFADVVLYRYTDKVTGDEMGMCYSDVNGNSPINNPDWNAEVINEKDKKYYIGEQRKQIKARRKAEKDALKATRKDIKDKLKAQGLTQQEVDILVGEND